MFNIENIHIELSSKCTLKCPRCPRTEIKPENNNKDISLEVFKNSFDLDTLRCIKRILFCGHLGDPIYARDFLDICRYIKENSDIRIDIVTNGSYKDSNWWLTLGKILNETDQVIFSIDGWDQKSNELYRVNSDFDSIIDGIKTLVSLKRCQVNWSTIYFSFNEKEFNKIKDLARSLGADTFRSVKSSKFDWAYWDKNNFDPLKPDNKFVSKTYAYEFDVETFKRPNISLDYYTKQNHQWAKCLNQVKELFISVNGLVFPCAWFSDEYQPNSFIINNQSKLSIFTRSLTEILNDELWNDFVESLNNNPLDICKIKCKNVTV
jgi:MoaA/NifB/PqqE/SkfB family radical SAM enzyme